jgi:hypothetical protein
MDKFESRRYGVGTKRGGKMISSDEGSIKNISETGICLETSQRISTNSIYRIEISNGKEEKKPLTCEVVWTLLKGIRKENDENVPVYEAGLKFIELSDLEKQFVCEIISDVSNKPAT